ncbi:MAG: hypothetical protein JWN79_3400 [Gemmatimonadetes bacterium]|nr:hypothetical protein [Gemmatimonadota bacterium]
MLTRAALFAELERGGIAPTGQRGIHILQRLSMEGLLCFGPHDAKQPTFVLLDEWVPAAPAMERDDALRTLAERYFGGHGPARLRDFAGWTGLTMADARRGLALAEPLLERVRGEDDEELWMARDDAAAEAPAQRAHLLPGFDELMLGYKDRSASLPAEHAARVCPGGNGMFSNTLVADGRVVGTWKRTTRASMVRVEATSFAPLPTRERERFEAPAARLAHFLGVPVTIVWQ